MFNASARNTVKDLDNFKALHQAILDLQDSRTKQDVQTNYEFIMHWYDDMCSHTDAESDIPITIRQVIKDLREKIPSFLAEFFPEDTRSPEDLDAIADQSVFETIYLPLYLRPEEIHRMQQLVRHSQQLDSFFTQVVDQRLRGGINAMIYPTPEAAWNGIGYRPNLVIAKARVLPNALSDDGRLKRAMDPKRSEYVTALHIDRENVIGRPQDYIGNDALV